MSDLHRVLLGSASVLPRTYRRRGPLPRGSPGTHGSSGSSGLGGTEADPTLGRPTSNG
ncbi:hypothetical protein FM106_08725 [Brachybacterium faecium]|nr:hypothetical protein FM106_08725 [Brachybacterium faecium]